MGEEREEIYERIPWDSINTPVSDRRWLVYAVSGAIALGSLTYSFFSRPSQPVSVTTASEVVEPLAASPPPTQPTSTAGVPDPPTSPLVMSEADLMAVEPDTLVDMASAYAEWFAYEYIAFDGSARSGELLRSMLPGTVPAPESPSGSQVWVDWVRAMEARQLEPALIEVDVIVRSLLASAGGEFERLPPRTVTLLIRIDGDGEPVVASAPVVTEETAAGGAAAWGEVEMVAGIDGVLRPQAPMPDQP